MRLNFVYVNLCLHRSEVGLWGYSHVSRFDDGAGHRFFWRMSSKFSDQLPDHVQHVEGLRALHIPPIEPVGELEPSFSCCLGGVHNLASDACCKSPHREVDKFVKLDDLFGSQSIVLLSFDNELVLVPLLHLCR